ncbi:hypothetical protein BDF19DRAFT_414008 [Syncephalis fuscata]|nr:hypothetical protein BDF19DRAFT_414008 [Syncephalis fuscata]
MSQFDYERGARARRSNYTTHSSTATATPFTNTATATNNPSTNLYDADTFSQSSELFNDNTASMAHNTQTDTESQYEVLTKTASMLHNYSALDRDWSQLTADGYGMDQSAMPSSSQFTFQDPPATYLAEAATRRHPYPHPNQRRDNHWDNRANHASVNRQHPTSVRWSQHDYHHGDVNEEESEEGNTDADTTMSSTQNISQYSGDGHNTAMEGQLTRDNTMASYVEEEGDSVLTENSLQHDTNNDSIEMNESANTSRQSYLRRRQPHQTSTATDRRNHQKNTREAVTTLNEQIQCRICFCGTEEESTLGQLISPCLCNGTMRYVHLECLNSWRYASNNRSAFFKCTECGYKYSFSRTRLAGIIQNPVIKFLLSLIVFAILVFVAGFGTKLVIRGCLWGYEDQFFSNLDAAGRLTNLGFDDLDDNSYNDLDDDYITGEWPLFTDPEQLQRIISLDNIDVFHFLFGLFLVGIIGFLQFVIGVGFMGSIPVVGRIHIRPGGRGGGRGGVDLLLVVIIVIGILRAFWTIYQSISKMIQRNLQRLGENLLNVSKND